MRKPNVAFLFGLCMLTACIAAEPDPPVAETDLEIGTDSAPDSDVADEPDSETDTGPVCPPTDPACYFGFDLEGECCDERIWSARVPGQLGTPVDPALVRGCPVRTERLWELPERVYSSVCDDGSGVYRFCADTWPDLAEQSPWGYIVYLAAGAGYETPVPDGCTTPTPTCRFGESGGECCEDFWLLSTNLIPRAHGDAVRRLGRHHCPCLTQSTAEPWRRSCVAGWPDSSYDSTYFLACERSIVDRDTLQWNVGIGAPEPSPDGEPPCNLFQIIEASGVRE